MLLLARGVNIAHKEGLRMAASEDKDAAGIMILSVHLSLFFVCCIPRCLTCFEHLCWYFRGAFGGFLLTGSGYTVPNLVYLFL